MDLLHAYMDRWHRAARFDGTVAVAQHGRLVFQEGYGYANREHRVVHTPASRFQVGSITKSFISAAILQLVEQGKLTLDDPLAAFFPDHKWAGSITPHHLLSNTSGIPDHTTFAEYNIRESLTPATILARLQERDLYFPPGQQLSYSNSNYVLLAAMVEAVSGLPIDQYLERNIISSAGLTSSGVTKPGQIITSLASGYSCSGEGPVQAEFYDISGAYGSGFLYSTAEDLITWVDCLLSGKVISPASYAKMMTPYGPIHHMQASWGYGCYLRPNAFFMLGFISGYNCQVLRIIDEDLTVVLLSNNDTSPLHRIEQGLVKLITTGHDDNEELTPLPISELPERFIGVVGSYRSPYTGGSFTITYEDGRYFVDRLFAQNYRQNRFALNPISFTDDSCTFTVIVCDGTFTFSCEGGEFRRAVYTWDTFSIPHCKEQL